MVVVLGAGSIGAPSGRLRLGHFGAMRWADGAAARERLAEVFVGGEGLARGPVDLLGTLLDEAAHAIAHVRGIKDSSRQGRWHNTKFKALAEELGIEVAKHPAIGWSPTTLPERTQPLYAPTVVDLSKALRLYRSAEITGGESRKPGPPACVCSCGRRIRSVPAAWPVSRPTRPGSRRAAAAEPLPPCAARCRPRRR